MIWTLRVKCDSGRFLVDDCVRVSEMKADSSLLDLHDAIQDAVGFDQDHFFEFFAGRHPRNRKVGYADTFDSKAALDTYADISLEQLFPLPGKCKLFYHFDFGDYWYFSITKSRKKAFEAMPGVEYPRVTEKFAQIRSSIRIGGSAEPDGREDRAITGGLRKGGHFGTYNRWLDGFRF